MDSYSSFPAAPAYGQQLPPPPPPPFESLSSSQMDLAAMDSYDTVGTPSYGATPAYPGTPVKGVNLDFSKFKTKLCRHYTMGVACPFQERCAFAHGPEEQAAARAAAQAAAPAPPAYGMFTNSTGSDSGEAGAGSPEDSRPSTPPAYPSRFRYDPYSSSGVVFGH